MFATFSLLYVFFKMTKAQEQEAVRKNNAKWQRNTNQEQTFFDFLAGQVDEDSLVPNANQVKSKSARKSTSLNTSTTQGSEHSGFGSSNLEHLANEERGRFDDLEMDADAAKNPYTKLANF